MNKANAATLLLFTGLIGYLILRFGLPALQIERLIVLACFTTTALILMLLHRREKNKPTTQTKL